MGLEGITIRRLFILRTVTGKDLQPMTDCFQTVGSERLVFVVVFMSDSAGARCWVQLEM